MPARRYVFTTVWLIDAPLRTCWDYLTSPAQGWRDWWPALRAIDVERTPEIVGSRAACVWRSPIGQRLRFTLDLVAATPQRQIVLTSTGDLTGRGVVDFEASGSSTRLTVTWQVDTSRPWMNRAAPVLAPVFRWSHHLVMRQGRRGLNRVLRRAGEVSVVADPC